MIISASRRTDIPAFFGDWFMNRIEEGYFHRVNPYNLKQVSGFSLRPEDVDAIVFWTKNPKPFLKHLETLESNGYSYYFQHTLNDYPSVFEPHMPTIESRLDIFRKLGSRIGPQNMVWRYDPIIVSSLTPTSYHLTRIEFLARALQGFTDRLVISFMDFYGKTANKIKKLENEHHISFTDITDPEHTAELEMMAGEIGRIGSIYGMKVQTCTEAVDLDRFGIEHGSCIDARIISRLLGKDINLNKDKNQRDYCLCAESVDVGIYNTCRFNCVYCYAVQSELVVNKTLQHHIPDSASLIYQYNDEDVKGMTEKKRSRSGVDS